MHKYYASDRKPRLKVIQSWCKQILKGLQYLHKCKIVHRDLKCDNMFINETTGEVKIGDLGLATEEKRASSIIGTPEFMAPEIYSEKYDHRVDIYAFGMTVLEMLTGKYPYENIKGTVNIFKKVSKGIKPTLLKKLHPDSAAHKFIMSCIRFNPDER